MQYVRETIGDNRTKKSIELLIENEEEFLAAEVITSSVNRFVLI